MAANDASDECLPDSMVTLEYHNPLAPGPRKPRALMVCIGFLSGLLFTFPFCMVSVIPREPDGDLVVAKFLFPFAVLLQKPLTDSAGHLLVCVAQWPVYCAIFGWFGVDGPSAVRRAVGVTFILHALAVAACFWPA